MKQCEDLYSRSGHSWMVRATGLPALSKQRRSLTEAPTSRRFGMGPVSRLPTSAVRRLPVVAFSGSA